jgi:glucose-1-phosphate adenylyltransferase
MGRTLAMILAGGRGKRMDMFCQHRPKPALPFAGRYRVIDLTLSNCLHSQIGNIGMVTDYQRFIMADYLKQWEASNPKMDHFSILEPKLGPYAGTADAVYQNLDYLETQDSDTVLVLAGDHIYNMDYRRMLAFHRQSQTDITVGIIRVPSSEAHRFGTLTVEPNGQIKEFIEKSPTPTSNLASMGIYLFNREFLIERLKEDARNPASTHDFGYNIIPEAVKRDRVFGYEFRGYWQDIGTVEAYYEANMQLLREDPDFKNDANWPICTANLTGNNSYTEKPENIVNSLISPGCYVEGYVENSILSPGVCVEKKARVIDSIVMPNTRIGYHSVVDRSIVDEGVNIDKYCYVGFSSNKIAQFSDITMVGKNVSLGPQTAIGRKSKIMPGLQLTDRRYQFVPPGTVVPLPA